MRWERRRGICIGSSLGASPFSQAEPLGLCGLEEGWRKPEQKRMRAWSRVGASGIGKKAGTQFAGPGCEEGSREDFRTP